MRIVNTTSGLSIHYFHRDITSIAGYRPLLSLRLITEVIEL